MSPLELYRAKYFQPEDLARFFSKNPSGKACFCPDVGVGKTHLIIKSTPILQLQFPQIFIATSQHQIKSEIATKLARYGVQTEPQRDKELCGKREKDWERIHQLGISLIGKKVICGECDKQEVCPWFRFKREESPVTVLTQDSLFKQADDIPPSALIMLDETKFLERPLENKIDHQDILLFSKAIPAGRDFDWLYTATQQMLERKAPAPLEGLSKENLWRLFGALYHKGVKNILPIIMNYADGAPVALDKRIYYLERHFQHNAILVLGAGADKNLLEHYFNSQVTDLTPVEKYRDPGTKIYCIASSSASPNNLRKRASARDSVFSFVRKKIWANRSSNKRTLLVAKRELIPLIQKALPNYISQNDKIEIVHVEANNLKKSSFDGLTKVPIINYGVEGVNLFEEFECVICVSGFYIPEKAISERLKKLGVGQDIEVTIPRCDADHPRRVFTSPETHLAMAILNSLERDRIYQAVGRVRFWTKPREVIVTGFQDFEGVDKKFRSFKEAAEFFKFSKRQNTKRRCLELRQQGLTLQQISTEVGRTVRTVSRHLKGDER